MKVWIAGFGNEHREDDAAGVILAERIYQFLAGLSEGETDTVSLCIEHQLLPELVDELNGVDLAVFCDADTERYDQGFSIREVSPNPRLEGFNIHSMGPEWLLALAQQMKSSPRKALLVTISGERFDFSEAPTPVCLERIEKAEGAFRRYWKEYREDQSKILLDNMRFALRTMAGLSSCKSLILDKESFLLATGTDAASENWAFVSSPSLTTKQVRQACSFFGDLKLPFIWPLLPGCGGAYRKILEESGLFVRGELTAMSRTVTLPKEGTGDEFVFEAVTNDASALMWAETAWQAFDSPPGVPGAFANLARELYKKDGFVLLTGIRDGVPVGTAMVSVATSSAVFSMGVYYFATLPEARRSGVGKALMDEILRRAYEKGISLVTLQATPAGEPFYASCGFVGLLKIPLHSFSLDVF